MEEPKKKRCKICKETIYGLSQKDLNYKFLMHTLKHREENKDE